ncbi:hypothetical protein NKJ09_22440 [Mesorhizobium sp. M0189]|uniref:hypothetical protein n=1 Tax=unclassified Mesorhizobium TaxID=325217 RepID=UPI00333A0BD2
MFSDVAALQAALLNKEPKSFVSHHIFEPIPFAFKDDLALWIEWKRKLADALDVDPQDIVMTGSAAVGYSLNPHNDFKAFDNGSDFDCGVVSSYYFDIAWRYLRQLRVSWLSLPQPTRNAITSHRKTYVFAGTIAADKMLGILPFGQTWQAALDTMSQIDPTKGRDVKLRLYKDFDSLRYYQASNVERLRDSLGGQAESEPIGNNDSDDILIEDGE